MTILVNKQGQGLLMLKHKIMGFAETFSYLGIIILCSYLPSLLLLAPLLLIYWSSSAPHIVPWILLSGYMYFMPVVPQPSL